jgi:hypothetical protein
MIEMKGLTLRSLKKTKGFQRKPINIIFTSFMFLLFISFVSHMRNWVRKEDERLLSDNPKSRATRGNSI